MFQKVWQEVRKEFFREGAERNYGILELALLVTIKPERLIELKRGEEIYDWEAMGLAIQLYRWTNDRQWLYKEGIETSG